MIRLLFKENCKSLTLFLKNYLLMLLAFIIFSVILAFFIIEQINFKLLHINPVYVYLILIVVGLIVIFKKFPIFYIKSPIIYICFYTDRMKNIICFKYILTAFKAVILSLIICILLSSNIVAYNLKLIGIVKILFFNLTVMILSWINYNKDRNILIVLGVYLLACFSLLFQQNAISLFLSFIPLIICIRWLFEVKINWERFLEHSSYMYKTTNIAFKKNTAEMLSFALENNKTVDYKITFSNLKTKGSWVIIVKGLVELLRKPKVFYLINGAIFIASFILYKYNFYISLMLQAVLVKSIANLSNENLLSIINKQKNGLILPFSENEIWVKASSISLVLISIYLLILAIIKKISILKYIFIAMVFTIIVLVENKMHIKLQKYNQFIIKIISILIYTCIFLLLNV